MMICMILGMNFSSSSSPSLQREHDSSFMLDFYHYLMSLMSRCIFSMMSDGCDARSLPENEWTLACITITRGLNRLQASHDAHQLRVS